MPIAAYRVNRSLALLTVLALLASLFVALSATPAFADSVVVEVEFDSAPGVGDCDGAGDCTLRAAIEKANADGDVDTVVVPAGTYTLTEGSISVTDDLTLVGATGDRADVVIVGATPGGSGILEVSSERFTLADLTMRDGDSDLGGALYHEADIDLLEVDNVAFYDNVSTDGGAIYIETFAGDRIVSVTGSHFESNDGGDYGGGISAWGVADLLVSGSTFIDNQADEGGAVLIWYEEEDEAATLVNNVFRANTAVYGGALLAWYIDLEIVGSEFSGNAADYGGAVYLEEPRETVIANSTFSGNSASDEGGAIYHEPHDDGEDTLLHHVTIADSTGDGVAADDGATVLLGNTIIAGSDGSDCAGDGPFVSLGGNIDGDGSCGLSEDSDQPGTDPGLLALADYGGPTQTRAIAESSAAYEAGENAICLAIDQRGVERKDDCDSGAFELVPAVDVPDDEDDGDDDEDDDAEEQDDDVHDSIAEATPATPVAAQPDFTG